MANNDLGGVWRTIGGRRVFIKNGQSLEDAMRESGKFSRVSKNQELYKKVDEENKKIDEIVKKEETKKEEKVPRAVGAKDFSDYGIGPMEEMSTDWEKEFSDYLRDKYGTDDVDIITTGSEHTPDSLEEDFMKNYLSKKETANIEPVEDRLTNNMIVSHYGNDVAYRDKKNNLWVTSREQYNDYVNGKKDKIGGELVSSDDEALKTMIANEGLEKYPYEGFVADEKSGNDKKYKEFVDSEYNRLKDQVEDSSNARYERAKTNDNYKMYNGEFESKRVSEPEIREKGYQYFSTHGVGPGTHPDDVKSRELDVDLPGGWTTFKTDRPLTQKELDYYDIQPETRNSEFRKRFGLDEDNNKTGFTQKLDMYGGTREYSKEQLDKMKEAGIQPMEHSYTGGGWEGVNSNLRMDTKDQAKAITDAMKKQYPDVKISRKTNLFSGGSSIDFNIMSSDKDLFVSNSDIDKMGYEDLHDVSRSNGFEWWAKDNIKGYNENHSYNIDDVRKYAKESLSKRKESDIQSVRGNEWYLNDYGKKVVSELNKQANSYTYNDSDGMIDYFDHGTYMHISIGKWNKPYEVNKSSKTTNEIMNDTLRQKAYKNYLKQHPGSKMTLDEFKKKK